MCRSIRATLPAIWGTRPFVQARQIGHSSPVPAEARSALFDLLESAVLDIRVCASEGRQNYVAIGVLTNMIHALPPAMKAAATAAEYDQLLHETWDRCDERGRDWLRSLLVDRGIDPARFPATYYRMP